MSLIRHHALLAPPWPWLALPVQTTPRPVSQRAEALQPVWVTVPALARCPVLMPQAWAFRQRCEVLVWLPVSELDPAPTLEPTLELELARCLGLMPQASVLREQHEVWG